jgi:peptide/nickel transport system permease protein
MTRYLIRRSLLLVVTLVVTSAIIFALTQLLPGDVARLILGRDASPTAIAEFRVEFGLDQPVLIQYADWLGGSCVAIGVFHSRQVIRLCAIWSPIA